MPSVLSLRGLQIRLIAQHIELALPLIRSLRKSHVEKWFTMENSREKLEI
jgi:hypothetical protein